MIEEKRMAFLGPGEAVDEHPVADPAHIAGDVNSLRYMVDQLSMYLEKSPPAAGEPTPITVTHPRRGRWVYRLVIGRPQQLVRQAPLTFVGFLGQRRPGADNALIDSFDKTLVSEIPQHAGLLSYSSMALISGNYSNLVLFAHGQAKDRWSRSEAHDRAVSTLAPDYYRSIRLYNGTLPQGIHDSGRLQVARVKYFDYGTEPCWRAVRELSEAGA